ncbi:MAG: putative toxin-antitoxin system toxin component, PIN family [Nitrospirae bacterium]|nr:putative toxin-antitoxin system toxin component, PIN family [Nitrospirota bacterium]
MGKKENPALKVVLDTNILISALLFRGELSRVVDLWKKGRIVPVISKETFQEFKAVLHYPKFRLSRAEIKTIIEDEVLPFFEVAETADKVKGICTDPDDDKFIACAVAASADFIVTGDSALCDVGKYRSVRIIKAVDLLKMMD